MWISTDPALGEYIPQAPIDEEAKRHNQNLPGMGGVFNAVNLNLYHYAANNPIKYTDSDGRDIGDWQDNGDGTWTVILEGATLWDVWGADAYKVTGLSEEEAKNIQGGQTFGKKNNPKTPVGLAVLDKTTSIANSGVGVALGEIELADSIYCGVSNHSWEAGLKRAGRYATTIFVGFAVTYIGSALGGPWAGAILGFGAAMYVDSWFEKKGW